MPLNNKDETLRKNKALLATQARSLLAQIAVALDTRSLFKLFNPGPDFGPNQDDDGHGIGRFDIMCNAGTKRSLTTLAVNSVAALAAQHLFDGKARGFVELKIVRQCSYMLPGQMGFKCNRGGEPSIQSQGDAVGIQSLRGLEGSSGVWRSGFTRIRI